MGKTDGLKREGQFTKENAAEMQRKSREALKLNNAARKVMREVVLKRVTEEDRAAMCDALIEKARNGDEKSMTLLLQLLGEMPDTKQTIEMKMQSMSDADRELMQSVRDRYDKQ